MTLDRAGEFTGEGAGVAGIVEAHVIDGDALGLKILREMAHGGKQEGDLLAMVGDVGRLLHHLNHQHPVDLRVEVRERGDGAGELVPQDETQNTHGAISLSHAASSGHRRRRRSGP